MHTRTTRRVLVALAIAACTHADAALAQKTPFSADQIRSYPFPQNLTAAPTGSRIAWTLNERGLRNIFVAEGPSFAPRRLTSYLADDGQELTSVTLSRTGDHVVFVRGGEHSANWDDEVPVNALSAPMSPKVGLWSVPFDGGEPRLLAEGGDHPEIAPDGRTVAFVRNRQIWTVPIDGSAAARAIIGGRGDNHEPRWSPDGSRLAFVSGRGDHAFIGIYVNDSTPLRWMAPGTSRDGSPRWSRDGTRLAFVRRPGSGGAPDSILARHHLPWAIWTADASTGIARQLWKAPETLRGSLPGTHGGTNLAWGAGDRVVFLSYHDGWPHLYSVAAAGGEPLLLTPGDYMAEHISLTSDGTQLLFAANAGSDADDIDRRHLVRAPVDRAAPEVLTPGRALEWTPVATGDGRSIAYIGATAQRPPLVFVMPAAGGDATALGADRIPRDFPADQLVVPRKVVYRSPDGVTVHAQLFEPRGDAAGEGRKKPAVIFVHGGPPRQMLLGWHYSDYYSNAYALNQYLASRGFVVLSVNYRLGIGYGYEFHRPPRAGAQGAAEYIDVKAAARWLATQPQVDASRIGIWGGSYGGYLTALALARDSRLFAAGVDIHGVHDMTARIRRREGYEQYPDFPRAEVAAWRSSPIASVAQWKSPVLLIHGDDDRNVRFSATVDLVQRLTAAKVPFEEIVIPDDTHHFMRHANQLRVNAATAEFLERKLMAPSTRPMR